MSLALFPLPVCKTVIPQAQINESKNYSILKGSAETSWKVITTQSFSANSIQFTAPPPSPGILVDRKIWLSVSFNLTFTGTSVGPNFGVLQNPSPAFVSVAGNAPGGSARDAPRAYPLSSCITTLTAKLNNTDVSVNLNDVIQPLLRYHNDIDPMHNYDYSVTPSMMDQFPQYFQGSGSNRNPLEQYGTNVYEFARGGFAGISNVVNPAGGTSSSLTLTVTEPLFLSPMLFGTHGEEAGFIGLQTFDLNVTFGNLAHLWSHDVTSSSTISNIAVTINGSPQLFFRYMTPQEVTPIPRAIYYDYFEVNRYPTDQVLCAPNSVAVPDNTVYTYNSANIQLNSIPRRMYILARRSNQQYNTQPQLNWDASDTFMALQSISVNWNNRAGLLSGASQQDLYAMAVKNGCQLSWTQWTQQVGSVLCVDFGDDIGLNDLEGPGMLGTYQLQLTANFKNIAPDLQIGEGPATPLLPSLYVIIVSEGTFCITENRSVAQIGVISKKDVLDAHAKPLLDYQHAQKIYGGNFFGSIKKLFSHAAPFVKQALPVLGREVALPLIKRAVGLKGHGRRKRHMRGGQMIDRDELESRLERADNSDYSDEE